MKTIITLAILFVVINGYSQETTLVLKNKNTGREIYIQEGNKIKVKTKGGKTYRDRLNLGFNSDSVIVLENTKLNLDKIESISIKSSTSKVGKILAISGVSIIGASFIIILLPTGWIGLGIAAHGAIISIIITPIGLITSFIKDSFYYDEWEYRIKEVQGLSNKKKEKELLYDDLYFY